MHRSALWFRLDLTVGLLPLPEPPASHEPDNGGQRRADQNEKASRTVVFAHGLILSHCFLLERRSRRG